MPPEPPNTPRAPGRSWRPLALGGALAALALAGLALWLEQPRAPTRAPLPLNVVLSTDVPEAASPPGEPSSLPQTPGCGEIMTTTVCGRTVRCRETGEDRTLLRDDGLAPAEDSPCFRAMKRVRSELLLAVKAPLEQASSANGPFEYARRFGCASPSLEQRQSAYVAIVRRVRDEGAARAARFSDTSARAYWTELMRSRFDFVSADPSCAERVTGAFLLKVVSDVGAPGVLPYAGIWRIAPRRAPKKLWESLDSALASAWGAGDLDGDGVQELVTRRPNAAYGEASHVRYELVDVAADAPVVLLESVPVVDGALVGAPAVYGAPLPSGAALVVGDRILHYTRGALRPAPAIAKDELEAASRRARERILGALAMIDQPFPASGAADRCHSYPRLGWAHALAEELVAVGRWDRAGALAEAAALAGVEGCFDGILGR